VEIAQVVLVLFHEFVQGLLAGGSLQVPRQIVDLVLVFGHYRSQVQSV
jgi:hypothetical protein